MILTKKVNNYDYDGVNTINEFVLESMYNSQTNKRGELPLLEEALLNKKITQEDVRLILKFYCETPITTSKEDQFYQKLKKNMWEAYHKNGNDNKTFKALKNEFELLDLKLTPAGRQYAIESIVNEKEITYFESLYSNAPQYHTINDALNDIKEGRYKVIIQKIRNSESKDEKNKLKKKLPVFLLNGLFHKRNSKGFLKFSDYMCLDFDDFESTEDVMKAKEQLVTDPHVYACFVSPKGLGLKVLVRIKRKSKLEHLQFFEGAKAHFSKINGFDDACKDIARACFMSYDPELYINPVSKIFTKKLEVSKGFEKLSNSKKKISNGKILEFEKEIENSIFDETDISKIKKLIFEYWESKYSLAEGNRNNNLYKLAIKLYSAGVSKNNITEFFYKRFKGIFESDDELETIISSACKNNSVFNSKPWQNYELKRKVVALLDNQPALNELLIKSGVDYNDSFVKKEIEKLKSKNHVFWTSIKDKDDKITSYKVNEYKVLEFLKSANIFCLITDGVFDYYKITDNLIYELSIFDIKIFIVDYIRETQVGNELLLSTFLKQRVLYSDLFFSDLKKEEFKKQRDTVDKVYKYFLNGVLVIIKDKPNKFIDYSELEYPVFASQIIQHEYSETVDGKSDFNTFINDISGEGNAESFRSAIGYLCSNYKSESNSKAVILSDNSTSFQEANGGRGKSLISKAISKFSNVVRIDGKRYAATDGFALAPVKTTTNVVFIDDLKQGFHFTNMYNLISDDFEITKKYADKNIIPFKLAPKILLSSNYPIKGGDESSKRRRFDLVLTDYYSTKHTPLDRFGREFFTTWNEIEWNNFYHFMIGCIELFLEKGLISMSSESMKLKNLIADTSEDFMHFMNDNLEFLKDSYFSLEMIKIQYSQNSNHKLSTRKLKDWLTKWCDYHDYQLKTKRTDNKRQYIISNHVIDMFTDNNNKQIA